MIWKTNFGKWRRIVRLWTFLLLIGHKTRVFCVVLVGNASVFATSTSAESNWRISEPQGASWDRNQGRTEITTTIYARRFGHLSQNKAQSSPRGTCRKRAPGPQSWRLLLLRRRKCLAIKEVTEDGTPIAATRRGKRNKLKCEDPMLKRVNIFQHLL